MQEGHAPLAGIRVVELTTAWAGPMAGRTLAFLGAEVIRIEPASRPKFVPTQIGGKAMPSPKTSLASNDPLPKRMPPMSST
jgi:crotonobetainyl-CoA:carnitine CoA-transferase CaiB-like acyl-CoA transferase